MRVNVFVVTYQLFSSISLRSFSDYQLPKIVDVNDGGKREMQDACNASHVIRGAKIRFSSNGVMQCNSTLRAQQIVNVFDATHSTCVAQKFKLTNGADENVGFGSGY